MSDVLHVVSSQLGKTKAARKKTEHDNNLELISFSSFLDRWVLSLHNSDKTTTYSSLQAFLMGLFLFFRKKGGLMSDEIIVC